MRSSQETLLRRALPWPALATGAWSELGSLRLGERGVSGAIVGALIIRIGFRGILYHTSNRGPPKSYHRSLNRYIVP